MNPNKINATPGALDKLAKKNFVDTEQSVGETIEQVHQRHQSSMYSKDHLSQATWRNN